MNEQTPSTESPIQKAERLKKEMENERIQLEKAREDLAAERILGGGTPAGQTPEKKNDVSPRDYAKSADRGILLN